MVFVVTAVRVFNNETLVMFLERSWKILHGSATLKELQLTVIHTCAFHFMRNAKETVKRAMKVGSRSAGMRMLSLLMNRENIRDLKSAIKLIILVTCSKYLTNRVRLSIGTLNKVLKDFKADIFEETKKAIESECSKLTADSHKKKKGPDTEEDYYIKCEHSPFKIHFEKIYKN